MAPGPAPRVFGGSGSLVLVEAREIDSPAIAVLGWQRASVSLGQPLHSLPGKRQFGCPATITVIVLVNGPVDVDGRLSAREVPFEEGVAFSPGVISEANSIERLGAWIG